MSAGDRSPWRHAARFTLAAFVVLSFLPVWPAWYFSSWEGNGEPASFWTMLASLPRAIAQRSASKLILDYYGPDLVPPFALLGVCLLVGRWLPSWTSGLVRPTRHRATRHLALCLFLLATLLVVVLGW